ncbi:FliO/MopB family protein [Halonatronum saccharophilum]|uniref:FliO/MopB family protein n=1 Tax=Halonatronum saccharophilum TaxID=150060 RepID=UPI0004810F44|nr:flagellar biosynthetic protein FliO [Halonatronum saccharophilum]
MNYTLEIIKMILSLIAILSIFFLLVKLFKRGNNLFSSSKNIRLIERCYLDNGKVLYLVKVADKVWLLSSVKDKVEFIEEVDLDKVELGDSLERPDVFTIFKKGKE